MGGTNDLYIKEAWHILFSFRKDETDIVSYTCFSIYLTESATGELTNVTYTLLYYFVYILTVVVTLLKLV